MSECCLYSSVMQHPQNDLQPQVHGYPLSLSALVLGTGQYFRV